MPNPTIRSLAKSLRLSRSTVSEALRGSPRINPRTAARVQAFAKKAGYRVNPLASSMMSELRRSRVGLFRGVIAAVILDEPDRPAHAANFFRELIAGASERSGELGFSLETFHVAVTSAALSRLDGILRSRGIAGVMLLPVWGEPDFSALDWSQYAGVYTDYIIEHPGLHAICPDHYRSMTAGMQELHARGYRRPGLFLHRHHDERLHRRWEGAFLAFQQNTPGLERVPTLLCDDMTRGEFTAWFQRHQPDVVLGHHSDVMDWMQARGARVPETHGFFCLNALAQNRPCAGLDLQPRLLGTRAIELVIGQIQRGEYGIPSIASLTTIAGTWVEGPTLRPMLAKGN